MEDPRELEIEALKDYHSRMVAVHVAFWSIYTRSVPSKNKESHYKLKHQHLLSWAKKRQALEGGEEPDTTAENNHPLGPSPPLPTQSKDPPPRQRKSSNHPSRPRKNFSGHPTQPPQSKNLPPSLPPNSRKRKSLAPLAAPDSPSEVANPPIASTATKKRKPTALNLPQTPAPAFTTSTTTSTVPKGHKPLSHKVTWQQLHGPQPPPKAPQIRLAVTSTHSTSPNARKPPRVPGMQKSTQKALKEVSKERDRLLPVTSGETEVIVNKYPGLYRFLRRGKKVKEARREGLDIDRLIFLCSKVKNRADGKVLDAGKGMGVVGINCAEGGKSMFLKRNLARWKMEGMGK